MKTLYTMGYVRVRWQCCCELHPFTVTRYLIWLCICLGGQKGVVLFHVWHLCVGSVSLAVVKGETAM